MRRVLILHGWMHSAERYATLAGSIQDATVDIYEFPGFGNTPYAGSKHILNTYAHDLRNYLRSNAYDIIVTHSMGANILLRVQDFVASSQVVLVNPVYKGLPKITLLVVPCILVQRYLPDNVTRLFIKLMALLTVNKWEDIDDLMVTDVRRADPVVAARLLLEMVFDKYRVSPMSTKQPVLIIRSQEDRVIPEKNIKLLAQDIGRCIYRLYPKVGHTPVVECLDRLVSDINDMEVNK